MALPLYRSTANSPLGLPTTGGAKKAPLYSRPQTLQPIGQDLHRVPGTYGDTMGTPSGQYQAQSRMDGQAVLNGGDSKGFTPQGSTSFGEEAMASGTPMPRAYKPAQATAQDREMALIEQQAKNRLELARNQSDMQKAALLQGTNEQAYSQGIGKDTNAFWKMNQEAVDQSGMQSQNMMNEAFNFNADEMQQATAQRRQERLGLLQSLLNSDNPEVAQKAAAQLGALSGMGGDYANLMSEAYDPKNQKSEFAKANEAQIEMLNEDYGIQAPDWFAKATKGLPKGEVDSMVQRLKDGSLTEQGYSATQSIMGKISDAKSLESLSDEQLRMAAQDPAILANIKSKLDPSRLDSKAWPDNPAKGSVVFHENMPYRILGSTEGGQVVQSARDGSYMFFDDKHPQGIAMTQAWDGTYSFKTDRRDRNALIRTVYFRPSDSKVYSQGSPDRETGKVLPGIGRGIRDLF